MSGVFVLDWSLTHLPHLITLKGEQVVFKCYILIYCEHLLFLLSKYFGHESTTALLKERHDNLDIEILEEYEEGSTANIEASTIHLKAAVTCLGPTVSGVGLGLGPGLGRGRVCGLELAQGYGRVV